MLPNRLTLDDSDSSSLRSPSWPEQYRPLSLGDIALDPSIRRRLEFYASQGLPHHLVIAGPPGVGKTTVADVLTRSVLGPSLDGRVYRVNATQTRNLEFVVGILIPRMRVGGGVLRRVDATWREIVLVSEADGLTPEAQQALKDALEEYASTHTLIFTTNHLAKLDAAIQSRCEVIEMGPPPIAERARVLRRILDHESVTAAPDVIERFAAQFEDMRQLLREAQDSFAVLGELRAPNRAVSSGSDLVWPVPVVLQDVLDEIAGAFRRYLMLPDGAADVLALWSVFAHAHEAFGYSPILAAVSPVKRSGKTRLFEVLSHLVPNPVLTSNISAASIYRLGGVVEDADMTRPIKLPPPLTLLADEGDAWMKLHPGLRGILDSGHTRRAAFVIRVLSDGPTRFSTFFPKALALIDTSASELPPTIVDRSIILQMRRRKHDESVATLRADRYAPDLIEVKMKIARWVDDYFDRLRDADPPLPDGINDRTADNWRPLFAIAEQAGPQWLERAWQACRLLSGSIDEGGEMTVLLLRDIRDAFTTERADRMPTRVLVGTLCGIDDHPWKGLLSPFKLAQLLRPFNIKPKPLWSAGEGGQKRTMRGYFAADFREAFERYA